MSVDDEAEFAAEASLAQAEEALVGECSDILTDGVFNTIDVDSTEKITAQQRDAFCEEVRRSRDGSGGVDGNFLKIVAVKLTASTKRDDWEKYCSESTSNTTSDERVSYMARTASGEIANAWLKCMREQNGGLACRGSSDVDDNTILIDYDAVFDSGPVVNTSLALTNMTVSNRSVLSRIGEGQTIASFSLRDASLPATFVLNGNPERAPNGRLSCKVVVKSQQKLNAPNREAWNRLASAYSALKAAYNSSSLPAARSGTLLDRHANAFIAKVNAQYSRALTQAAKCSGASPDCTFPQGEDFVFPVNVPAQICDAENVEDARVFRAKEIDHNVYNTDIDDVIASWKLPSNHRTYSACETTSAEVCYRAYVQDRGWLPIVCDGEDAGTVGQSRRLEAVQIWPADTSVNVCYEGHVQGLDWQAQECNGSVAGTVGQGRRMEAVHIRTNDRKVGVAYRAYVQDLGWQGEVKNGATAGTTGQGRRMEAIRVTLRAN